MNACRLFVAVVGFAAFFASNANATCPTFHTLANGTTADAGPVMDNFDYILQCPNFTGNINAGNGSSLVEMTLSGGDTDYTDADLVFSANNSTNYRGLGTFYFDTSGQNEWFAGRPYKGGPPSTSDAFVIGRQGGVSSHNRDTASGTFSTFFVTVLSNGNMGIGTTAPSEPLEVNGLVKIDSLGSATATPVCELSGVLSLCSSSLRYKEDVKTASFGLSEVMQMRPVTFKWKDRDERDIGLLAEEVAKIDPLFVTYKNGEVEGVKYAQLTAVLINAVKQLKQTNDTQAVQIAALQRELSDVKRSIGMRAAENRPLRHRAQRS